MPILNQQAVTTIVTLAANEAAEAGHSQISTGYLLVALSRFSELQGTLDADAAKQLSQEFEQLGIEPRRFRRRLRAILSHRGDQAAVNTLHRSPQFKSVMAAAERAATEANEPLTPVLILRTAFASLGDDASRVMPGSDDDIPSEL